jgi:hypothetical protein
MVTKTHTPEGLTDLRSRLDNHLRHHKAGVNVGSTVGPLLEQLRPVIDRLVELELRAEAQSSSAHVRWSRFVQTPDGKFSNGRFYFGDEAVEVVRAPEVTSKKEPTSSQPDWLNAELLKSKQALVRHPEGRFALVNFESETVDKGYDFGALFDQANSWTEVANCIHELDPDWHRTGKPAESAIQFIRVGQEAVVQRREKRRHLKNVVEITGYDEQGICRAHFTTLSGAPAIDAEVLSKLQTALSNRSVVPATPGKRTPYTKGPSEHPADREDVGELR